MSDESTASVFFFGGVLLGTVIAVGLMFLILNEEDHCSRGEAEVFVLELDDRAKYECVPLSDNDYQRIRDRALEDILEPQQ